MKFGTIADPLSSFDPEAETTFFILKEITKRGHENWIMEIGDLMGQGEKLQARAKRVRVVQKGKSFSYDIIREQIISLDSLDCLFLRKDPPVDVNYHHHLSLVETVKGPLIINSPHGIRAANEKIMPLTIKGAAPPSLVSASRDALFSFLKVRKKCVIKPLNASGGRGVFIVHYKDPNRESLLETATQHYRCLILLQKYIREAPYGDKRVLLLGGEPIGSFLRIPSKGDFRGNMHAGARWVKTRITRHEDHVIKGLKPRLIILGLHFVGLDFIGPYLTEVNTTSPMGIREVNQLENSHIEKKLLNWVERHPKN